MGVNSLGHVAGRTTTNADEMMQAFLWTPQTGMKALGILGTGPGGTRYTEANGINDSDWVVGDGTQPSGSVAFLWTPTCGLLDLNNLIPANSGWTLYQANAINNVGQIVGYGNLGGKTRAFLLTPH